MQYAQHRVADQRAIVSAAEVLQIESIGADQIPRGIDHKLKTRRSQQRVRLRAVKER